MASSSIPVILAAKVIRPVGCLHQMVELTFQATGSISVHAFQPTGEDLYMACDASHPLYRFQCCDDCMDHLHTMQCNGTPQTIFIPMKASPIGYTLCLYLAAIQNNQTACSKGQTLRIPAAKPIVRMGGSPDLCSENDRLCIHCSVEVDVIAPVQVRAYITYKRRMIPATVSCYSQNSHYLNAGKHEVMMVVTADIDTLAIQQSFELTLSVSHAQPCYPAYRTLCSMLLSPAHVRARM